MGVLGEHCSMTERRADDATRDVADALKCEYMQDHVGDVMVGTIAAVTNFGFFVRLNDIHIDGLVHVTSLLSDYYIFDAGKQTLKGERTGRTFRIGDVLEVKVLSVNLDDKKIDFELANQAEAGQRKRPQRSGASENDRPIDKRARKKSASKGHSKDKDSVTKGDQAAPKDSTEPAKKANKPKRRRPIKQGEKNTASSKTKKTTSTAKKTDRAQRSRNQAKKADS